MIWNKILISFALACLLGMACSDQKTSLRDFYYPYDGLKEGLVYEYRSVNQDSLTHEYSYFKTFEGEKGEKYLTCQVYDPEFNVSQIIREEYVSNGVLMDEFRLLTYDSLGRAKVTQPEIQSKNVFPFDVSDEPGYLYFRIAWDEPLEEGMRTTLSRGKQFQKFSKCPFKRSQFDCAEFTTVEVIEFDHPEEGTREYEIQTNELFARGIGLIYYKKKISEDLVLEYVLEDRYPMSELEEKLKMKLGQ